MFYAACVVSVNFNLKFGNVKLYYLEAKIFPPAIFE